MSAHDEPVQLNPESLPSALRIVALEADLAREQRTVARLVAALVAVRQATRWRRWTHEGYAVWADDLAAPLEAVGDLLPSAEPRGWDQLDGSPESLAPVVLRRFGAPSEHAEPMTPESGPGYSAPRHNPEAEGQWR